MKLILANNQTEKFKNFYSELARDSEIDFDYSSYSDLLFIFKSGTDKSIEVINTATDKNLSDYDGVYVNGYLNTYDTAASVALCCKAFGVPYVNKEFDNPVSLSKLSMNVKLNAGDVLTPYSVAGSNKAIKYAIENSLISSDYPMVLKRADADRGIDNFKTTGNEETLNLLQNSDSYSIWFLQEYVENTGYYLVAFYNGIPKFSIYRDLLERPDGNQQKTHMYKPKGGTNASLISIDELPKSVVDECSKAAYVMNRQIASVDCIYNKTSDKTYVLEVNYNPQLVTIETFKEIRVKAFLENLKEIK
ncbi:MAG: hypothetical protein U0451_03595 [Candidatus Saccharimonadales bacterium]